MNRLTRTAMDDEMLEYIQNANETLIDLWEYMRRRNEEEAAEVQKMIDKLENVERKVETAMRQRRQRTAKKAPQSAIDTLLQTVVELKNMMTDMESQLVGLPQDTPVHRDMRIQMIKLTNNVYDALDDVESVAKDFAIA